MIVILRKKGKRAYNYVLTECYEGKAKSENSMPRTQETYYENQARTYENQVIYENQVTTKEDPTYEMISNEIPSINTHNYSNYTSLSISTTDNSTIYDVPETRPQVSSCPYKVGHFK